jgi:protein SCO1
MAWHFLVSVVCVALVPYLFPLHHLVPLSPCPLVLFGAAAPLDDFGPVGDFTLTERSGRPVSKSDLLGKIWIASFEFTRCTAGCPQISETMERLQTELARFPDVRLVTFTVDPEHDHPEELREYAKHYHADPERWLFLTGDEKTIYQLLDKSFHLPAQKNTTGDSGNAVMHSPKLVLVDRQGHIRGYFDGRADPRSPDPEGDHQKELYKLKKDIALLEHDPFPGFNATLNAATLVLLLLGYSAIRFRLVRLHIACMVIALGLSVLFLVSYLYDHGVVKQGLTTSFASQTSHAHPPPWVGVVYQIVLWTHTPLAAAIAPLALYTAYLALRRRFARHRAVARWALPIWIYVAITGVVVYWMLYRLYPWP